jgi:CheY-like chemotaxis protein
MSHEFRTPLNSVRALCKLLLGRADGPLTPEQETQVRFISKAAEDLSELVNDLLDLAKIEAGKIEVRPARFEVSELFSALRGMLRPLLVTDTVELVFEEPRGIPELFTDESKVSQILRNFISNALKFTERGSVRVEATLSADGESVVFAVHDTGIGIALEDREMVFEEFTQVPSPLQRRVKGTGLGLPLCRKLAQLLGGEVYLESEAGKGSTFYARVRIQYQEAAAPRTAASLRAEAGRIPPDGEFVLVVEDDEPTRLLYEKYLKGTRFAPVAVPSLAAGREILRRHRPAAVVLDILLPGEEQHTWRWLAEMKAGDRPLPVIVVSQTQDSRKALSLGADAWLDKPVARARLLEELERLSAPVSRGVALIIDDDAASRYVLRRSLAPGMMFHEAHDGASGLEAASRVLPGVIFLDIAMPDMRGDEVLLRLKDDPATAAIPVVVVTSHELDAPTRRRITPHARAILQKKDLSVETLANALAEIGSSGGAFAP